MRRAAAEGRTRPRDIGTDAKKYRPGLDPLEKEATIMDIQPIGLEESERMMKMINRLLEKGGLRNAEKNAFQFWKAQLAVDNMKGLVKREFLRDFWAWLLGRGKESDHKKCPWYRQSLANDEEVAVYCDTFLVKRTEFQIKLQLLRMRHPVGINQHYLYFKYVVRGEEPDADHFLEDWQLFVEEFETGRVEGNAERNKNKFGVITDTAGNAIYDGEGAVHEMAPYGPKRAELAKKAHSKYSAKMEQRAAIAWKSDDLSDDEAEKEYENPRIEAIVDAAAEKRVKDRERDVRPEDPLNASHRAKDHEPVEDKMPPLEAMPEVRAEPEKPPPPPSLKPEDLGSLGPQPPREESKAAAAARDDLLRQERREMPGPSNSEHVQRVGQAERDVERLREENARLQRETEELRRQYEADLIAKMGTQEARDKIRDMEARLAENARLQEQVQAANRAAQEEIVNNARLQDLRIEGLKQQLEAMRQRQQAPAPAPAPVINITNNPSFVNTPTFIANPTNIANPDVNVNPTISPVNQPQIQANPTTLQNPTVNANPVVNNEVPPPAAAPVVQPPPPPVAPNPARVEIEISSAVRAELSVLREEMATMRAELRNASVSSNPEQFKVLEMMAANQQKTTESLIKLLQDNQIQSQNARVNTRDLEEMRAANKNLIEAEVMKQMAKHGRDVDQTLAQLQRWQKEEQSAAMRRENDFRLLTDRMMQNAAQALENNKPVNLKELRDAIVMQLGPAVEASQVESLLNRVRDLEVATNQKQTSVAFIQKTIDNLRADVRDVNLRIDSEHTRNLEQIQALSRETGDLYRRMNDALLDLQAAQAIMDLNAGKLQALEDAQNRDEAGIAALNNQIFDLQNRMGRLRDNIRQYQTDYDRNMREMKKQIDVAKKDARRTVEHAQRKASNYLENARRDRGVEILEEVNAEVARRKDEENQREIRKESAVVPPLERQQPTRVAEPASESSEMPSLVSLEQPARKRPVLELPEKEKDELDQAVVPKKMTLEEAKEIVADMSTEVDEPQLEDKKEQRVEILESEEPAKEQKRVARPEDGGTDEDQEKIKKRPNKQQIDEDQHPMGGAMEVVAEAPVQDEAPVMIREMPESKFSEPAAPIPMAPRPGRSNRKQNRITADQRFDAMTNMKARFADREAARDESLRVYRDLYGTSYEGPLETETDVFEFVELIEKAEKKLNDQLAGRQKKRK